MSRMLSLITAMVLFIVALLIFQSVKKTDHSEDSSLGQQKETIINESPAFDRWREFSPPDRRFRVLLPSLPQHVKDKFIDPLTKEPRKYDAFMITESGKPVFMIGAISFPSGLKKERETETTLKAVVDEILTKNKDNKLKTMLVGKFRSFPSIDFSISNGEAIIAGKAFASRNALYILTIGNDQTLFNQHELDFFINSFQILDEEK